MMLTYPTPLYDKFFYHPREAKRLNENANGAKEGYEYTIQKIVFIDKFRSSVTMLTAHAQDMLNELESVQKGSADNKEYTAMRNALVKLIRLQEKDRLP